MPSLTVRLDRPRPELLARRRVERHHRVGLADREILPQPSATPFRPDPKPGRTSSIDCTGLAVDRADRARQGSEVDRVAGDDRRGRDVAVRVPRPPGQRCSRHATTATRRSTRRSGESRWRASSGSSRPGSGQSAAYLARPGSIPCSTAETRCRRRPRARAADERQTCVSIPADASTTCRGSQDAISPSVCRTRRRPAREKGKEVTKKMRAAVLVEAESRWWCVTTSRSRSRRLRAWVKHRGVSPFGPEHRRRRVSGFRCRSSLGHEGGRGRRIDRTSPFCTRRSRRADRPKAAVAAPATCVRGEPGVWSTRTRSPPTCSPTARPAVARRWRRDLPRRRPGAFGEYRSRMSARRQDRAKDVPPDVACVDRLRGADGRRRGVQHGARRAG